jgi:hypothetical protein
MSSRHLVAEFVQGLLLGFVDRKMLSVEDVPAWTIANQEYPIRVLLDQQNNIERASNHARAQVHCQFSRRKLAAASAFRWVCER